jgi:hypothetical protein
MHARRHRSWMVLVRLTSAVWYSLTLSTTRPACHRCRYLLPPYDRVSVGKHAGRSSGGVHTHTSATAARVLFLNRSYTICIWVCAHLARTEKQTLRPMDHIQRDHKFHSLGAKCRRRCGRGAGESDAGAVPVSLKLHGMQTTVLTTN